MSKIIKDNELKLINDSGMTTIDIPGTLREIASKYKNTGDLSRQKSIFDIKKIIFTNTNYYSWFVHSYLSGILRNNGDTNDTNTLLFGLENITFDKYIQSLINDNSDNLDYKEIKVIDKKDFRNELISFLLSRNCNELKKILQRCSLDLQIDAKEELKKDVENVIKYLYHTEGVDNSHKGIEAQEKQINSTRVFDFASRLSKLFKDYEQINIWENITNKIENHRDIANAIWQKNLYKEVLKSMNLPFVGDLKTNSTEKRTKKYTALTLFNEKKEEIIKTVANDNVLFVDFDSCYHKTNLFADYFIKNIKSSFGSKKDITLTDSLNTKFANPLFSQNSSPILSDRIVLSRAVSKLREVENIFNQICELVRQEKDLSLEDIAIYSPNLGDYYTEIMQVFSLSKNKDELIGDTYPFIPISINVPSVFISGVTKGINDLDKIAKKGYFDRCDLVSLLENKAICEALDLTKEDVKSLKAWIEGMNVYRDICVDETTKTKNWEKSSKRLACGMLIDDNDLYCIGGKERVKPYSDLSTGDKDLLSKYFKIIQTLDSFCKIFTPLGTKTIDRESVKDVFDILYNLFDIKAQDEDGDLKTEAKVFKNVICDLSDFLNVVFEKNHNVPLDCVLNVIKDSAINVSISIAGSVKGVNISSLSIESISPKKYVFLLGMGLENYPKTNNSSAFDLINIKIEGREVFKERMVGDEELLQAVYRYTSNKLFISYNYMNLQKDAELYLSPSVLNLLSKLHFGKPYDELLDKKQDNKKCERDEIITWVNNNQYTINLDSVQTKNVKTYDYLYTCKQIRNKECGVAFDNALTDDLNYGKNKNLAVGQLKDFILPEDFEGNKIVTTNQIKKYLEDPFVFRINQMFGEDEERFENISLEPIKLNNLQNAIQFKEFVKDKLEENDETTLTDFSEKYGIGDYFSLIIRDRLVSDSDKIFKRIRCDKDGLKDIEENLKLTDIDEKSQILDLDYSKLIKIEQNEFILNKDIFNPNGASYKIKGELDYCLSGKNNDELILFSFAENKKDDDRDFLGMYVSSLCYLLREYNKTLKHTDREYKICMWNLSCGGKSAIHQGKINKSYATFRSYRITLEDAIQTLLKICYCIEGSKIDTKDLNQCTYGSKNCYLCIPVDLLKENSKPIETLQGLNNELNDEYNGKWKFFKHKILIDITDTGYREDNFKDEWKKACEYQKELIRYIK